MESRAQSSEASSASSSSETDAHLDEPTIAAVQAAAKEALKLDHDIPCHRFAEGTHHAVYAIGSDVVARCLPKSEKAVTNLRRDVAVQTLARKYFSNPAVVPEVLDAPLVVGGWQGNLDRRIRGVSLQQCQPTEQTEEDLAALLMDLRSVPVEEAVAATGYQQEKINIKARVTKAIRAWEELIQKGHAVDPDGKMQKLLNQKLQHLATFQEEPYKPSFVHADINTENILLDSTDGSITGVIDWSDAIAGDPCIDLSGVVFAVGVMRARRVGEKALLSEFAIERALLYTMTEMVRDIRKCLCRSDGNRERSRSEEHLEALLREEFERVFGGTGLKGISIVERR